MTMSLTLPKLACLAAVALFAVPSLASADDRWGGRGRHFDRGERYYGRNFDRSSRFDRDHWRGGRSRSHFNFSFGFSSGRHWGDRSFGGISFGYGRGFGHRGHSFGGHYGYRSYGGYHGYRSYRPVYPIYKSTRVYSYEPYYAPTVVYDPPPVVYYPARTYHYPARSHCYPSGGVSVSTRFYYRR